MKLLIIPSSVEDYKKAKKDSKNNRINFLIYVYEKAVDHYDFKKIGMTKIFVSEINKYKYEFKFLKMTIVADYFFRFSVICTTLYLILKFS